MAAGSVRTMASGSGTGLRIGIAHHYGWAVAVTATAEHAVVDRRRIELIEPGLPVAPIHHEGGPHELHRTGAPLTDEELASLVAEVRASVERTTTRSLVELAAALPGPVATLSVRVWPADFPTDLATLRRVPYESQADSVMYRQVLTEVAEARGWAVHRFDAATVEASARAQLGGRADDVLLGPRKQLGAPWAKDHRLALASTILVRSS
jgi:hypothetical protein